MAQALLARKEKLGTTSAYNGIGLLNLRGEMYSSDSEAGKRGVQEVHKRLSSALVEHLVKCDGFGIVVFEEVQKVIEGGLNVLLPALDKRGALTVFDESAPIGKQHKSYTTENLIFLFTTDLGGPIIRKLIMKYNGRENIPHSVLRATLVNDVEQQGWGKPIVKYIKEVVPFLPLGHQQMVYVCRLSISNYASRLRGNYWLDLVVDDEVVEAIANSPSLFENNVATIPAKSPQETNRQLNFYSSKLGARGLENGQEGLNYI